MAALTDIISLPEAKSFLNIDVTTYDTEIGAFISAASAAWINRVGPVAGSTVYDEWHDGGGPTIVLRHPPVQSITAITEAFTDSIAYTLTNDPLDGTGVGGAYGYTLEKDRGLIVRRAVGTPVPFAYGLRNVHVTYVAGYATTPADITQAVQLLVKHMWETQRGGRPGSQQQQQPMSSFTWPPRVDEIADSYIVPGIA